MISIVCDCDNGEEVIGHGHIVDGEPVVDCLAENGIVALESMKSQYWREVAVTAVATGHQKTAPHQDSVFAADGTILESGENRCMSALARLDEVLIWRDYVVPRRKQLRKVKSRKKR